MSGKEGANISNTATEASTDTDISSLVNSSQSTTSSIPDYTDSHESVISLLSSDTKTGSQDSIITISTDSSQENLVYNTCTSLNSPDHINLPTASTSTAESGLNDFREFCPSTVRYCQGLTVLTGKKNKATSTVTDIQIFMTSGGDQRLVSEESEDTCPVYVLCKASKIIALLVDKIDPGQYILTFCGKKIKVDQESKNTDGKNNNNMYLKKAVITRYKGSIIHSNLVDTKILMLGSFHKQPFMHKVISTNQLLSTKVALLNYDISQQFLEQNSPIKHDQILLQIINNGIRQMTIIEKRKEINKSLNDIEPVKKKPKFQLRIVLQKNSEKKMRKAQVDSGQGGQCSMDNFVISNDDTEVVSETYKQ